MPSGAGSGVRSDSVIRGQLGMTHKQLKSMDDSLDELILVYRQKRELPAFIVIPSLRLRKGCRPRKKKELPPCREIPV